MTKQMTVLFESILASTARTVRAVVLILTIGLVTGSVPGVIPPDRPLRPAVQTTVRIGEAGADNPAG